MGTETNEDLEDARERLFWRAVLNVIWAALVAGAGLAVLWAVGSFLAWQRHLTQVLLGLLAGICVAVAIASTPRHRALVGLVVGGITLPVLAAYLSSLAARSPETFSATSESFLAFVVSSVVAFLGGLWIAALSQRWPGRQTPGAPPLAEGVDREGAVP